MIDWMSLLGGSGGAGAGQPPRAAGGGGGAMHTPTNTAVPGGGNEPRMAPTDGGAPGMTSMPPMNLGGAPGSGNGGGFDFGGFMQIFGPILQQLFSGLGGNQGAYSPMSNAMGGFGTSPLGGGQPATPFSPIMNPIFQGGPAAKPPGLMNGIHPIQSPKMTGGVFQRNQQDMQNNMRY